MEEKHPGRDSSPRRAAMEEKHSGGDSSPRPAAMEEKHPGGDSSPRRAAMEEKHSGSDSSPNPCHLAHCDDEVFIACPHCEEFVCFSHIDDHGCKGRHQLQIVEEKLYAVNTFQAYLFIKMLQEYRLQPSQLQKMIASYFSPETLNKLSLNCKWYDYITSNKLWKKFCHFPELYWKEAPTNTAILEKQHFSPYSLWKYNYDNECLLQKNWESGIAQLYQLNLLKLLEIKLGQDYIDRFGKHWLFLTDNFTLYIWEIRNEPRFHLRMQIKFLENIRLPKMKIILRNEKLFIITGNFVEAYAFNNPDYNLEHLYSFVCDGTTKIENYCCQEITNLLNDSRIKDFCVHVLDNAIIGHAGFTSTGITDLHIWDPNSGNKIVAVGFPLPIETKMAYVKSELCPLENDIILNAALYLNDGTKITFLLVTNIIKAIADQDPSTWSYFPAPRYLTVSKDNDPNLVTYVELPEHIVFCKKISKYEIITCRQHNRQLEFHIFDIKGGKRSDLCSFTEPLNKNSVIPSFKIHLFKGMKKGNGILCVAVEDRKIKVIDLRSTILDKSPKTKFLCKVRNVRKLYFISQKYVLILLDKEDIGEIWDAEEGHIITNVNFSNEYVFVNATWHGLTVVPPPKLIIYNEREVFIFNFEQN